MDKKSGVLAIILLAAILVVSLWISKYQVNPVNCSDITSGNGIDKCVGNTIVAMGTLECREPTKVGTVSLSFNDGTGLAFLDSYDNVMQDCANYNGKRVQVTARVYQCGPQVQCAGIGLSDIESVKLME